MLRTVALRAAHQLLDDPPIFVDAVAPRLVSEASLREVARTMGDDHLALRTVIALRSRFAEDRLAQAAIRNVSQYVMLGAGLDTFPWRQPDYAQKMRLFAADHPNSIARTRGCLQEYGLCEPANLTMVAVDLEDGHIGDSLVGAGFNPRLPAFCSALGVTQYLTRAAIDSLLAFTISLPANSEIAMSFVPAAEDLSQQDSLFVSRALQRVAAVGEPWRTRLKPREFVKDLYSLGYSDVFHLTPEGAYARYFAGRRDGRSAPGFEQMICAIV
jgi:methyltransferase (TIGR00027 family)